MRREQYRAIGDDGADGDVTYMGWEVNCGQCGVIDHVRMKGDAVKELRRHLTRSHGGWRHRYEAAERDGRES